ncbi:MAG: hypothetical protein WCT01_03705 [Candidatus Shapirobacteria bacterium]|jgi:hypothetical protein
MEHSKPLDTLGITLIAIFFILLSYAGFLSYKSIDWNVLKRMENQPLSLPALPVPATASASPAATPSAAKLP